MLPATHARMHAGRRLSLMITLLMMAVPTGEAGRGDRPTGAQLLTLHTRTCRLKSTCASVCCPAEEEQHVAHTTCDAVTCTPCLSMQFNIRTDHLPPVP